MCFVYWGTGELLRIKSELETYVEVLVWNAQYLEVGVITYSLCNELVQGEDIWHGC